VGHGGRAGAGWLQLNAVNVYQRVRIEAHDAVPPPESQRWQDVFETPYHCSTGTVGLTSTTDGNPYSGVQTRSAGTSSRVRGCRRPAAPLRCGIGGQPEPNWNGRQIARASSVNAATTRSAGRVSTPSS
jgi:hypothetical protein